jgi:hypothetical protein
MGFHFNTLAEAIDHFQRMKWSPWMKDQRSDGSWNSVGFRKRYTDEGGRRSELFARFISLHDGIIFVSVYDRGDLPG